MPSSPESDISFPQEGRILSERGVKNWLQIERERGPLRECITCY